MYKFIIVTLWGLAFFLTALNAIKRLNSIYYAIRSENDESTSSPVLIIFSPICMYFGSYISSPIFSKFGKIGGRLAAAGLDGILDVPGFIVLEILFGIAGGAVMALTFYGSGIAAPIIGISGGIICAWLWLGVNARRRKRSIEMELPDVLDMLTMSVEAGLDFVQAISRINSRLKKGPMKDELMCFETAIRIGIPRREALLRISKHADVPALNIFVSQLIQADKLGTSIGPVLRSISSKLRMERFGRAERRGIRASQMVLFPLVFCIMPATFIVVFGPLIARFVTGGLQGLLN